jgi:hypothetical protein
MKISEPATMITDYALAGFAIVFGWLLMADGDASLAVTLWAAGFWGNAVAAICGGTFHGFGHRHSRVVHKTLWNVTIGLIGLGSGFMISGTMAASLSWADPATGWLFAGLGVSLAGIALMAFRVAPHRHFNHNDTYHAVQIVALYLFYRGVDRMG